ncbi:hypothetical protein STRTUCAR8_10007 [Streptomyces turgidiscabies Car8]|uniref:Uncharacterized protein n=1 Tax=Streptomyces turgidiscabies (strain Car8) TaxID=698760 RepID=L7F969_STRT8|nr:hypothetical protein STRTUCAR8_10007 [Streptomyces turgidiscabies Car8]
MNTPCTAIGATLRWAVETATASALESPPTALAWKVVHGRRAGYGPGVLRTEGK